MSGATRRGECPEWRGSLTAADLKAIAETRAIINGEVGNTARMACSIVTVLDAPSTRQVARLAFVTAIVDDIEALGRTWLILAERLRALAKGTFDA